MDESSKEIIKEKQSTSKKLSVKTEKVQKKPKKKIKGQKDIRTLIKSKKNELLTYAKDFSLICKQSGIDVDPEQLQLAIALSKSLQDSNSTTQNRTNTEKSFTCNQRSKIRTTLQEYGFQTTKPVRNKTKRYRKHYKLILTSDIEKKQRIADKYAQVLINVCTSKTNDNILYNKDNTDSYLYNLTTNIAYECTKNDEIFYVNDLVPKSLYINHIFKDWSKIPGRPVSPKLEKLNLSFKDIRCSQEELNKILSGPIEVAQDIVKRNYRSNSYKTEEVISTIFSETNINQQNFLEIKPKEDLAKTYCENKTIGDKLIAVESNNNSQNMSEQINRSFSPDLFDDEVTIIMDNYNNKTSVQEGISDGTKMVTEQNNLMDLTDCIDIMNSNYGDSKHIVCLSQGSNKTRSNSNDFMDLTECVPIGSQKLQSNYQSISRYQEPRENRSVTKNDNYHREIEVIDVNETQNFICDANRVVTEAKSLDDTTIMIDDEDYSNIYTRYKYNVPISSCKESCVIDLVENEYKSCKKNTMDKDSNSTLSAKNRPENNNENKNLGRNCRQSNDPNGSQKINSNKHNCNTEINSDSEENSIKDVDQVDLTQSTNFEDFISCVNVHSLKTIVNDQIHTESGSHLRFVLSENSCQNGNEEDTNGLEKSENFEAINLTQSSNSDDYLQESCFTKAIDDNEVEKNVKTEDYVDLCRGSPERDNNYKRKNIVNSASLQILEPYTAKNALTVLSIGNDHEFDNLIENVSNASQGSWKTSQLYKRKYLNNGNVSDNGIIENETNNQEIDMTPKYDYTGTLSDTKNLNDEFKNMDDVAHNDFIRLGECSIIELGDASNKFIKSKKSWYNKSHNSEVVETKLVKEKIKQNQIVEDYDSNHEFNNRCDDISKNNRCSIETPNLCSKNEDDNILSSDIDLTQESDCSDNSLCCSKIVEVTDELGKKNNISIDYDEVSGITNVTRKHERNSSFDINKSAENNKSGPKDDGVSISSQHSEIFELSDNEFNYSVNQYMQDNDSLDLKQAKFDIGGISIIEEFLNRNSLPKRSTLRCSCSSNGENNTDIEIKNCLPTKTLEGNEILSGNAVNTESKSCEESKVVKIITPLKSRSDDNILIAKTPKHDNYIIKTDEVTPMPNYENMTSPERNEELDKFGIKPLKRKRAIQILTHIHHQTHPVMEVIPNDEHSSPSKVRRKNNVESFPKRTIASQIDCFLEQTSIESSDHVLEISEPNLSKKSSKSRSELPKNSQKSPKKTSCKENVFYEDTTFIPDIRNIECSPEDWVFQKREKAKVHSCRVPLHIVFHNYVSSRTALREAILRYEPINIDDIHKGLVAVGYRYNPKDLLKFMDKKCITVKTADNARKNKNT